MAALVRVLLAASLVGFAVQALHALADERIEGVVRRTAVTHCDATKKGGCAGTLTLERDIGGTVEMLAIRVPLGTPISRGSEMVRLHALAGNTVVITLVTQRGAAVAQAIQVTEP
jgi:hypothetical protein